MTDDNEFHGELKRENSTHPFNLPKMMMMKRMKLLMKEMNIKCIKYAMSNSKDKKYRNNICLWKQETQINKINNAN